jgi:anti-sigma regulatory factor (Ser/Thr protein kinase)
MMTGDAAENDLERIRLAVTEACANVVRHAYPDDPGMLDVGVCVRPRTITVEVRDRGVGGAEQRAPGDARAGGLGLPLIDMLADRVEITPQRPGTSVRMTFDLH